MAKGKVAKFGQNVFPSQYLAINRTNAHSVDRNAVMGLRKTSLLR